MTSSRLRVVSVLALAMLMVVVGCSIIAFRANAQTQTFYRVLLRQRHQAGACVDVGTITIDKKSYALPATVMLAAGFHSLAASLPSGCGFVTWETEGGVSVGSDEEARAGALASNGAGTIAYLFVDGEGTVRLVNKGTGCCGVGGVALPTNTLTVFAPYLAVIGLVAVGATVAVKKRRN